MPIPKPNTDEKQAQYISRCMSNSAMKKEFPDQKQRTGVCVNSWKKAKGENMESEKRDEQGRLIVAENVPIIIEGVLEVNEDD